MSCFLIGLLLGVGGAVLGWLIGHFMAKASSSHFEKTLKEKDIAFQRLKTDYSTTSKTLGALQTQNDDLEATHRELTSALDDFKNRYGSLYHEYEKLRQDKNLLNAKFDAQSQEYMSKVNGLESELEVMRQALNALKNEKDLSEEAAVEKYINLKSAYDSVVVEKHDFSEKVHSLLSEKSVLSSHLEEQQADINKSLVLAQDEISHLSQVNDELEGNLEKLSAQVQEYGTKEKTWESAMADLHLKYKQLATRFDEREAELKNFEDEQHRFSEQLDGFLKMEEEYNQLAYRYNHLLDRFNENQDNLKLAEDDKSAISVRMKELEIETEKLIGEWQYRYNDLESLFDEMKAANKSLLAEKESLHAAFEDYKTNGESDLTVIRQSYEQMLRDVETKEHQIATLSADKQALNQLVTALQSDTAADTESWSTKYDALLLELKATQDLLDELRGERDTYAAQYQMAEESGRDVASHWQSRYENIEVELHSAKEQLEAMVAERDQYLALYRQAEDSARDLQAELLLKQDSLHIRLDDHKQLLSSTLQEKEELTHRMLSAEEQGWDILREWQAKYDSIGAQLKETEQQVSALVSDKEHLEFKLDQLEKESAALNSEWQATIRQTSESSDLIQSKYLILEGEKNQLAQQLGDMQQHYEKEKQASLDRYFVLLADYNELLENHEVLREEKESVENGQYSLSNEMSLVSERNVFLNSQLDETKSIQEELSARYLRLQSEYEQENQGWQQRFFEIEAKANEMEEVNRSLQEALSQHLKDLREIQSTLSVVELDKNTMVEELEVLKSENAELRNHFETQATSYESDLESWRERYGLLEQQFLDHQEASNALKQEKESLDLELGAFQQSLQSLAEQIRTLQSEKEILSAEVESFNHSTGSLMAQVDSVNTEKQVLQDDLQALRKKISGLELQVDTLESANDRIHSDLESLNNRYIVEIESTLNDVEFYKSRFENSQTLQQNAAGIISNLESERDRLADDYSKLNALYQSIQTEGSSSRDRYESLIEKVKAYELHIVQLEEEIATLRKGTPLPSFRIAREMVSETEEVVLERIKNRQRLLNFDRIGLAGHEHDDLERIKGIGPFTVRKLNALGIYTFRQLASFTNEDIELVNDAIEFFPGRIRRDDWVGQARQILGMTNFFSAGPAHEDDLKIVEGVGPKIEELLKSHNVLTWADLASLSVDQINSILDTAGPHFQMHDPATWPAQASLASLGKWEELQEWQKELKGGKV